MNATSLVVYRMPDWFGILCVSVLQFCHKSHLMQLIMKAFLLQNKSNKMLCDSFTDA